MRRRFVVGSSLVVLLALVGCGDDDGLALDGRTFLLSSAQGYTPVPGTTLSIHFENGDVAASAGCNSMSGHYEVRGGALRVSSLGSTDIGCNAQLLAQDQLVGALLGSAPRIALDGQELTLIGSSVTMVLLDRKVADPDRPLVGSVWTVDSLIQKDAVSDFQSANPPRITFAADGTFSVTGPCNSRGGKYVASDRIKLGDVETTDAVCGPDTRAIDDQLGGVFVSGASLTFKIDADKLTLQNGELGVIADAP